jgi:hypothetical protein
MLYYIKVKPGLIHSLVARQKDCVEVYIDGIRFLDFTRGTWSGTGPARRAIRSHLEDKLRYNPMYTDEEKEGIIKDILKKQTGTDPSYRIYLKVND